MKSITRQTCYTINLLYRDHCKSERKQEGARSRTVGQGRTEKKVSGDEEIQSTMHYNSLYTQEQPIRLHLEWGVRTIKLRPPETPDFSIWEVGAGLTPSLTTCTEANIYTALTSLCEYVACMYVSHTSARQSSCRPCRARAAGVAWSLLLHWVRMCVIAASISPPCW